MPFCNKKLLMFSAFVGLATMSSAAPIKKSESRVDRVLRKVETLQRLRNPLPIVHPIERRSELLYDDELIVPAIRRDVEDALEEVLDKRSPADGGGGLPSGVTGRSSQRIKVMTDRNTEANRGEYHAKDHPAVKKNVESKGDQPKAGASDPIKKPADQDKFKSKIPVPVKRPLSEDQSTSGAFDPRKKPAGEGAFKSEIPHPGKKDQQEAHPPVKQSGEPSESKPHGINAPPIRLPKGHKLPDTNTNEPKPLGMSAPPVRLPKGHKLPGTNDNEPKPHGINAPPIRRPAKKTDNGPSKQGGQA